MSKESTQKRIMEAIDISRLNYDILSRDGDRINHVRVLDFGDIWPTTGTAQLNCGDWIRKNPDKVIGKLRKTHGQVKEKPTKTDRERISDLETNVKYLMKNLEELNNQLKI